MLPDFQDTNYTKHYPSNSVLNFQMKGFLFVCLRLDFPPLHTPECFDSVSWVMGCIYRHKLAQRKLDFQFGHVISIHLHDFILQYTEQTLHPLLHMGILPLIFQKDRATAVVLSGWFCENIHPQPVLKAALQQAVIHRFLTNLCSCHFSELYISQNFSFF